MFKSFMDDAIKRAEGFASNVASGIANAPQNLVNSAVNTGINVATGFANKQLGKINSKIDQGIRDVNSLINQSPINLNGLFQSSSFNGGGEFLANFIKDNCLDQFENNDPMKFFNSQMTGGFNPDINGRILCFLVPPPFLNLEVDEQYLNYVRKLSVFSAVDFSPPVIQAQVDRVSARTGGIAFVSQIEPSEQTTATFLDNSDLDIYNFHRIWIDYMHELVLGYIDVSPVYLDLSSPNYGGLDYAGSLFFVKYDASMNDILYVGKATGVFPQMVPNKEILGQRSANDLSVINITYYCGWFEENSEVNSSIRQELEETVISFYGG